MEQKSDEWLQLRKGKFTGSEIWKLMVEPRSKSESFSDTTKTYILEKIAEEYLTEMPEQFVTTAMQWGNDNESLAKKWYSKFIGKGITEIPFIHHMKFSLSVGGSPDGFIDSTNSIIEIKCPYNPVNHIKHILCDAENMKAEFKEYYWQMQFYIECMKADYCDFISFDPRVDADWGLHIKRIERNDSDIELMNTKIENALQYKEQLKNKLI